MELIDHNYNFFIHAYITKINNTPTIRNNLPLLSSAYIS